MTSAAREPTKGKSTSAVESSVYDGSRLMGVIASKAGRFVARLADGRALGAFATEREAMRAICAADRLARLAAGASAPAAAEPETADA